MHRLSLLIPMMVFLLLAGCTKNEFTLEFDLDTQVSGSYRIVYHAASKKQELNIEATAIITAGKCLLKEPIGYPSVLYVYNSTSQSPSIVIYAERGNKITITGKSVDPLEWEVAGNHVNEELSAWRLKNLETLHAANHQAINKAIAEYVKDNKGKKSATLLMLTAYDRGLNPEGFARLWNSLSNKARDQKLIDAVGRIDQPGNADVSGAATIAPFRLYVKGDTIVTVDPAKAPTTLLYFWDSRGDSFRRSAVDSLKNLMMEPGDTTAAIIDISFEPDSVSWSYRISSDSTLLTHRGWMAAGRMNPALAQFDLPRIPYFVVIDKKGVQKYRGSDLQTAAEQWKSLRKSLGHKK